MRNAALRRQVSKAMSFLAMMCALLLMTVCVEAQVTTADIVGTVLDASGAVVTNATVTATESSTGEVKTASVGSNGEFLFSLLQVGNYRVSVTAAGFKGYAAQVTLAAGDRARVNATLSPGQSTETVEVHGTTPALQSDSSTVGTLITSEATQNLPLNGRNVLNLITTSAGVTGGLGNGWRAARGPMTGGKVQISLRTGRATRTTTT